MSWLSVLFSTQAVKAWIAALIALLTTLGVQIDDGFQMNDLWLSLMAAVTALKGTFWLPNADG